MSALVDALLPALAQIEREQGKVELAGTHRKRQWRVDPINRAIEAKRKRDKRRKNHD